MDRKRGEPLIARIAFAHEMDAVDHEGEEPRDIGGINRQIEAIQHGFDYFVKHLLLLALSSHSFTFAFRVV